MCISQQVEITYSNNTKKYQILRIEDLGRYVERVIPPRQKVTFEARSDAIAHIYTAGDYITALLSKKTKVYNLQK